MLLFSIYFTLKINCQICSILTNGLNTDCCITALMESTEVHIGTIVTIAEACIGAVAGSSEVGFGAVMSELGAFGTDGESLGRG